MQEQKNEQKEKSILWQALGFAWEFGYLLAIPLAVFAFGGRMLDKYLGHGYTFFIIGILLSLSSSSYLLYKRLKQYMKDYDDAYQMIKEAKKDSNSKQE